MKREETSNMMRMMRRTNEVTRPQNKPVVTYDYSKNASSETIRLRLCL